MAINNIFIVPFSSNSLTNRFLRTCLFFPLSLSLFAALNLSMLVSMCGCIAQQRSIDRMEKYDLEMFINFYSSTALFFRLKSDDFSNDTHSRTLNTKGRFYYLVFGSPAWESLVL